MKLDHIKIEGYKSFRSVDLELKYLNVLIGANGSGKSNFISIFRLLNKMVNKNFEQYIAKTGDADSYLYLGEKNTKQILLKLFFGSNGYEVHWQPTQKYKLNFSEERSCFYGHGSNQKPYDVYLHGTGYETGLIEDAQQNPVSEHVLKNLISWVIYHFHDTSNTAQIKKPCPINLNEYLMEDGGNLAAFLYSMQKTHNKNYERIRDIVRLAMPFFDDFHLQPKEENPNMIFLEWKQKDSDYRFYPFQLSDGTLRFICLVTVLLQPNPPTTIIIDEPELGLHPYAISLLGSLMRKVTLQTKPVQLIISTQSVELVNQFQAEDIVIADRDKQETKLNRLNPDDLTEWLKEYTLGELWEKNVLGGKP